MNISIMTAILWTIFLGGCSPGSSPPESDSPTDTSSKATPKDGFQEDPLAIATFGGNVFAENKRFAMYSFIANRVSVIDPDREEEIWGRIMDADYDAVYPLPGISGIGLVSASEFTVVGEKGEKRFPVDIDLDRWVWARLGRAVVFNASTSDNAVVIRHQSNGVWRSEEIQFSRSGAKMKTAAPLISADGNTIVEILPDQLTYLVYRASDLDAPMEKKLDCEISGRAEDQNAPPFATIYAAGTDGQWLLVTSGENAAAIAISDDAGCVALNDINLIPVVSSGPLRRVVFVAEQKAVVASESGEVVQVEISADDGIRVTDNYGIPCVIPAGLNYLGGDLLAITCATEFDFRGEVSEISLVILDLKSGDTHFEHKVKMSKLAGVAVDPQIQRVFEFLDGGLGELRITDMKSESVKTVRGLFTKGILNDL